MYSFIPITDEIVEELILKLSGDHIEELQLLTFSDDISETVRKTVQFSDDSWACYSDEKLCGIFGIGTWTLASDVGQPWVLLTDEAQKHKRQLLIKAAKIGVAYWMRRYSRLVNYVPSSYTTGLRWLKMLGFEITPVTATLCKIEMR